MSTSVRITVDDYERMIAEGRFEPREEYRAELILGEIVPMSPIGHRHDEMVELLEEWSYENRPRPQIRVRSQAAVDIPGLDSVPQPDLFWARRKSYRHRRPAAPDLLLLVEVADSSLSYDRTTKAGIYATAGVADYWIVNIPDECVEVHRDPKGGIYRAVTTFRPGQSIPLLAFPTIAFPVATLFEDDDEPDNAEG
jgi:Uma2 family endonuclease